MRENTSIPEPKKNYPEDVFVNRELSQLEFFWRVLDLAHQERTPLLERLRFLTICSTILDEFFEIRVAGLKELLRLRKSSAGGGIGCLQKKRELRNRWSRSAGPSITSFETRFQRRFCKITTRSKIADQQDAEDHIRGTPLFSHQRDAMK